MALDEFSFYTEALTAWLASNCQDKSQLLQGKALEDTKQLVGCRSLSEQVYQFLIASQELEKQELLKQLEVIRQETQDVKQQIAGFLASARTELATPINGIICSLKIIIDEGIDDEPELEQELIEREFLDDAHRSALDTLDVVNDLVAIAELIRLETNKFYLELEPIKLASLLTEVENSFQNKADEKKLNFQFNGSAPQDEIIAYENYCKLRQVMLRLVGDAIKYTDEGGITIVVEMIEQKIVLKNQEHPGLVKIHIANDKNKYSYSQNSLLRFFQQMNYSSIYEWYCTPAFGLAMSKKLIEAMSGEFHFDVKGLGCSTTVTISLPLYQETVMT
jgi:signal transduction histidine kinase